MSNSKRPYIVEIKRNSLDDGPGIRSVIFFKGCPLSCVWCQNPESKSPNQELIFEQEKCSECGDCIDNCKYDCIDFDLEYPIQKENCTYCGECIKICQTSALKFAGYQYELSELLEIILKDRPFFQNSGGGVTFSGGEPTMHMTYLHNLLIQLKNENIHTCLETCGYYNKENFENFLLPYLDLIYFDLKLFDPQKHQAYCKTSNKVILRNFKALVKNEEMEVLPRIPLIPDITATENNLKEWAKYLNDLGIRKIGLLPYNPLWTSKMKTLGKKEQYGRSEWMSKKEKQLVNNIFHEFKYRDF
jgi:pyruvate formate lyase activating enzyme